MSTFEVWYRSRGCHVSTFFFCFCLRKYQYLVIATFHVQGNHAVQLIKTSNRSTNVKEAECEQTYCELIAKAMSSTILMPTPPMSEIATVYMMCGGVGRGNGIGLCPSHRVHIHNC